MKSFKPTLIAAVGALTILAFTSVRAEKPDYEILHVPEESPGAPWYADISREFIPTDGKWVSIVFWREPTSVPEDFNLLDWLDIPRVFSAPLLLEGKEWWTSDSPPPIRIRMANIDIVPVYFVRLEELEYEIADDVLTLAELEAFSSLRVGYADHVRYDIRSGYRAGRNDGAMYTASGIVEDGGRFHVRLFEAPNHDVDAVIRFSGPRHTSGSW